jgi:hypothetical protein
MALWLGFRTREPWRPPHFNRPKVSVRVVEPGRLRVRLRPGGQGIDGPSHEDQGTVRALMRDASDASFEASLVGVAAVAARADVDNSEEGDLPERAGIAQGPDLDTND